MDPYTQARLAAERDLQQVHQDRQREEQARMVGAAALEEMQRAQERAQESARERQLAQEAQNRAQGLIDNWR